MELENEKTGGAKVALILAALMASLLLSALDSTIVSTAMKTVVGELGGMEQYAWPFTIYMLCSTVMTPISGGLADIFGRKRVFTAGIATFLAGSAFCGLAQNMAWLILFRGVQGIGSGVITTCVFTVVADLFPPQERGKYMGVVTSVFGLSSIVGPLAGGLITDYLSWRWNFFINIPIGAAALLLIALFMPNFKAEGHKSRIDAPGISLLVLSLVPLLLALSFAGSQYKWASAPIIGLLAFSAAMLFAFVRVELKAENPVIPMSFFKERSIWNTLITAFLSSAVMYAAIIYIPYFAQGILGTSATTSGAVTIPMTIAVMATANGVGVFASHKSALFRPLMVLAFVLAGIGSLLLSLLDASAAHSSVVVSMVIIGAGLGFTMPIVNTNVQNAAPVEQLSTATGTIQFFRSIGSTIGSAVFGTVMTSAMAKGFASLNLEGVPPEIRGALVNPQAITNAESVQEIIAQAPPGQQKAVEAAIAAAKDVLLGGIHEVFICAAAIAAIGLAFSLFFKSAPMRIVRLSDLKNGGQEPPAERAAPEGPAGE